MILYTTIKGSPNGIEHGSREDGMAGKCAYVILKAQDSQTYRKVTIFFERGNITIHVDGEKVFP